MKRFSVLSLFVLFSVTAYAQEKPSVSERKDPPATGGSVTTQEESRMRALGDQVRALVGQVAALRGELKTLRDAKPPAPGPRNHVFLTSTRLEPRVRPSAPTTPALS